MDNETTNTTQQPEPQPQRAGNLMIGPAEDRPKPGPTFEERLAEARQIMEQGGNPLEALVRRDPEPAPDAAAPDPAAAEPVAPTEPQTAAEPAACELPAGWVRLDNGLHRGPDGRFYSKEQVRALRSEERRVGK